MKKGILIGLVLGFALGAGVMHLLRVEPKDRTPERPESVRRAELPPPSTQARQKPGIPQAPPTVPQPPAPTRPILQKALPDGEILTALRAVASGGAIGPRERSRLVQLVWKRKLKVPATVVEALLSSTDPETRRSAAWLAPWAVPSLKGRLPALILDDPSWLVRSTAVSVLDRDQPANLPYADTLTQAARDPEPGVRIAALNALANLVRWRPALGEWVAAGTMDGDPDVREYATNLLRNAGSAGASRAMEILLAGEFDPDDLDTLVRAALPAGRIREVLDRHPRPEVVTEILEQADLDDKSVIAAVSGRFRDLLPLFQPENADPEVYAGFFRFAVVAGDLSFLEAVITSPERPRNARLGALSACLGRKECHLLGIRALRNVLRDGASSARFRQEAIEHSNLSDVSGEFPHRSEMIRVLEEARDSDSSPWVRESAEEALRGLKGE